MKMKKQNAVTSTTTTTTATVVDPKAELKALAIKAKALRAEVKASREQDKAKSAEASKEVAIRWIGIFKARVNRLESKKVAALANIAKLEARLKATK
jgi:hypothetical protein